MYSFSAQIFASPSIFNRLVGSVYFFYFLKEVTFDKLTEVYNNKLSLDLPAPTLVQAHGINRNLTDDLL